MEFLGGVLHVTTTLACLYVCSIYTAHTCDIPSCTMARGLIAVGKRMKCGTWQIFRIILSSEINVHDVKNSNVRRPGL